MRIAHVVTLISPDGAYGGPVRVAMNQAKALIELGHSVTVFAGTRGFDSRPSTIDGVDVELFPVHQVIPKTGFAGLTSPALLRAVAMRLAEFDVVHVHLARDLVVMPIGLLLRRRGKPYVVQTHGMIDSSNHPLSYPFDALATRRVLRSASHRLYLTPKEQSDLKALIGKDHELTPLPNGVPRQAIGATRNGEEVLFLARLQKRKQPSLFVESAVELAAEFSQVSFSLVGPDEGEAAIVDTLIEASQLGQRLRREGPLDASETIPRMRRASCYVLPSVNEPFPMSVLEAMSLGLPVVVSDSCGLAPAIELSSSGRIFDGSQASLTAAIRKVLSDPEAAEKMGANGRRFVSDNYSIEAIAQRLEDLYAASRFDAGGPSF